MGREGHHEDGPLVFTSGLFLIILIENHIVLPFTQSPIKRFLPPKPPYLFHSLNFPKEEQVHPSQIFLSRSLKKKVRVPRSSTLISH